MPSLADEIDALAAEGFSGVVRVDHSGETVFAEAYGLADRAHRIPNRLETQFATASGTKSLTALAVVSLVAEGALELTTTARSLLSDDLPLIDDRVTVEQLLAHRSGIGDYLDEEADLDFDDYLMPVPVQNLATTEQYLAVLDGHPAKFEPDERFGYCNSGFVLLALMAERASGVPYHDLVEQRVTARAGMNDTRFLRSDELPARAAHGYLDADGLRTNVFHLPVRGNGDGGTYTTAADVAALWRALFAGEIVSNEWVAEMIRPRSERARATPATASASGCLGKGWCDSQAATRASRARARMSRRRTRPTRSSRTWRAAEGRSDGFWTSASSRDRAIEVAATRVES
jgi:CubicO group peptidase (beta-lactamase class C family)